MVLHSSKNQFDDFVTWQEFELWVWWWAMGVMVVVVWLVWTLQWSEQTDPRAPWAIIETWMNQLKTGIFNRENWPNNFLLSNKYISVCSHRNNQHMSPKNRSQEVKLWVKNSTYGARMSVHPGIDRVIEIPEQKSHIPWILRITKNLQTCVATACAAPRREMVEIICMYRWRNWKLARKKTVGCCCLDKDYNVKVLFVGVCT